MHAMSKKTSAMARMCARAKPEPSELEMALRTLVEASDSNALVDSPGVLEYLVKSGISQSEALRVCLLSSTPGFQELIDSGRSTRQSDLDRFVQNAIEHTGLKRSEVLRLTADVALATGVAHNYMSLVGAHLNETRLQKCLDEVYVVPFWTYLSDLKRSQAYYIRMLEDKDWQRDANEDERLNTLVRAGIPYAKYFRGMLLMHDIPQGGNVDDALRLLREASEDGVAEAHAALADYYYEQGTSWWGQAIAYYSGVGSMAITSKRKERVANILDVRKYNKRLMLWTGFLVLAMAAFLIISPGSNTYPSMPELGALSLLTCCLVFADAIRRFRANPYGEYRTVPVVMLFFWTVFVALRLLL